MKPAPNAQSTTVSPSFSRPSSTATRKADGMLADVVLPKRSIVITTLLSGMPEPLLRRLDDADVGLVRHEEVDVGAGQPVALDDSRP